MKGSRLVIGLALSLLAACASGGSGSGGGQRQNNSVITTEEIRSANAMTAFEVVQTLRPAWLRKRSEQSFRESARGGNSGNSVNVAPGIPMLVVYLDNARIGGPEALRQVEAGSVVSIQLLDPAAATYRWGQGHTHGAILMLTQAPR